VTDRQSSGGEEKERRRWRRRKKGRNKIKEPDLTDERFLWLDGRSNTSAVFKSLWLQSDTETDLGEERGRRWSHPPESPNKQTERQRRDLPDS
jgi:hypothetical protein